jgi:nitroreductase
MTVHALSAILERVSIPLLEGPAPTDEQLAIIYRAAFRGADHAGLKPWRFICIKGAGLQKLGELFAVSMRQDNPNVDEKQLLRQRSLPMRAPLLIALIHSPKSHPKVPGKEQLLSLGCAAQNILNVARVLGLGAMWRTGAICRSKQVASGLGLTAEESLEGFIYLGQPACLGKKISDPEIAGYVSHWVG